MRFLSWLLSFLLHGGVVLAAVYLATPGNVHVDLNMPVYQVELVNLQPKKGRPAKVAPKPEPKPTVDVTPPPAPPAPAPAPQPKPEAKAIADKIEKPKPEPKKAPEKPKVEKKPEPKPKKPEKTKEQLLAEALAEAKKKAEREAKQRAEREEKERERLEKQALADIAKMVAESDAEAEENGEVGVSEDGVEDGVPMGLEAIYAAQVKELVKANWRFPNIPVNQTLAARVFIRVDSRGLITESVLLDRSGRPDFDASVLQAVQETEQLPPPLGDIREIRLNFNLQDMR